MPQSGIFIKKAIAPYDAMKLRVTGFERFSSVVIHRAKHTRRRGPPLEKKACLGFFIRFEEFPNPIRCNLMSSPFLAMTNINITDEKNKSPGKKAHKTALFLPIATVPA